MHEYSITASIIEILEKIGKKNSLDKIKKVNFIISPLASLEPDSIKFYYEYMTEKNELLKGAELVFEKSGVRMRCLDCEKVFEKKEFKPICSGCGSSNILVQESEDIKIVSVDT